MKVTRIIAAAAMSAVLAGTVEAQGPATNSVLCTGGTPSAASCRVQNTVQATVPWVASLEIVTNTTLPSPTAEDFGNTAGRSTTTPTALVVRANTGVTISATAATATWSGPWAKPAADLRVFLPSAPSTMLPLSTTISQQVFQSTTATASTTVNIGYNVLYSWGQDVPGNYSLGVNYTLTSP